MNLGYDKPLCLLVFDRRDQRLYAHEIRPDLAIGRTLWKESLIDLMAGDVDRGAAVNTIADRYVKTAAGFTA